MDLKLVTDEELQDAFLKDIESDRIINEKRDSDFLYDGHTRKWGRVEKDVKKIWEAIPKLNIDDFSLLCEYLKDASEPTYRSKIGVMARAIKYRMTSKQRQVCYRIIMEKYSYLRR